MGKRTILLNNIADIKEFISKAQTVKGNVTIFKDRFVVDGKSLVGLFSIDLSSSLIVEFPENDSIDFEKLLERLEI